MQSDRSPGDIWLAPLHRQDLATVAEIHERAFADSAITAFGRETVCRYYRWLLEGPHDAALVGAWHGDAIVGFCAAGVFRGAMSGFLRANRVYLARRMLARPSLIASPLIRDRIREAIKITARFSRLRRTSSAPPPPPQFGVLSIATSPTARGLGIGRSLMQDAERRARANGFPRMVLTVHPDNMRAVTFYEQLGWERRIVDGAWHGAMFKELG